MRAVELDINPEWVAAYLYGHRGGNGPLAPVPIVPGQPGAPGQFLAPYSRDFLTIVSRRRGSTCHLDSAVAAVPISSARIMSIHILVTVFPIKVVRRS